MGARERFIDPNRSRVHDRDRGVGRPKAYAASLLPSHSILVQDWVLDKYSIGCIEEHIEPSE